MVKKCSLVRELLGESSIEMVDLLDCPRWALHVVSEPVQSECKIRCQADVSST